MQLTIDTLDMLDYQSLKEMHDEDLRSLYKWMLDNVGMVKSAFFVRLNADDPIPEPDDELHQHDFE